MHPSKIQTHQTLIHIWETFIQHQPQNYGSFDCYTANIRIVGRKQAFVAVILAIISPFLLSYGAITWAGMAFIGLLFGTWMFYVHKLSMLNIEFKEVITRKWIEKTFTSVFPNLKLDASSHRMNQEIRDYYKARDSLIALATNHSQSLLKNTDLGPFSPQMGVFFEKDEVFNQTLQDIICSQNLMAPKTTPVA